MKVFSYMERNPAKWERRHLENLEGDAQATAFSRQAGLTRQGLSDVILMRLNSSRVLGKACFPEGILFCLRI